MTRVWECGSCGAIIDHAVGEPGEDYHDPDEDCRAIRPWKPAEVWYTATLAVETPRGRRWQGITFAQGGREWRVRRYANEPGERLPRRAIVRYRSPLRRFANEAYEAARSRTIHHNLYHGDDPAPGHVARWCHERTHR